jgi:arachidonate 15-lipoxygenase
VLIGDHVPADEASTIKSRFFDLQVGLYGGLSPMEPGLPPIDADPQKALDEAYTAAHRKCFPAPVLPPEYQGTVDLGALAVRGALRLLRRACAGGRLSVGPAAARAPRAS